LLKLSLLFAARGVDLQVARGNCRRVSRAVADLHYDVAAVRDAQEEHVVAPARFLVVYGASNERDGDLLAGIAPGAFNDANAMEINDVDVNPR
jgi:hypothetical protein